MNTFVTHTDPAETFVRLDNARLGKQRLETLQIVRYLVGCDTTFSWASHPAVGMWRRHAHALIRYGQAACAEWRKRGFLDNIGERLTKILAWYAVQDVYDRGNPDWVGDPRQVLAHRSNLIRKSPAYYSRFWPDVPSDLPYIWWRYNINEALWVPTTSDLAGYNRIVEYVKAHQHPGVVQCLRTGNVPIDTSVKRSSVILGESLSRPPAPIAPTSSGPRSPSAKS